MTTAAKQFPLIIRRAVPARPGLWLAAAIIVPTLAVSVLAPWVAPFDPVEARPLDRLQPPNSTHWMGTDVLGMDILSRLMYAPRIDLMIALGGTALGVVIGVPAGLMLGYWSKGGGEFMMRAVDVLQAFPFMVLAMVVVAVTSQNIYNVIFVLAVASGPTYLRLVRGQVLFQRERLYTRAARAVGNSDMRIMFRHLLPNSVAPVLAQIPVDIAWAVLLTAGLSFIGVGVRVPTPEWGAMIASGSQYIAAGQWWLSVFPGIALTLVVLAFTVLGNSLQQMLQPEE